MVATSKYYITNSPGSNLLDFDLAYGSLSLVGQEYVFSGTTSVDIVFVRPGIVVDFTGSSASADKLYLTGSYGDYAKSLSGTLMTLTRTVGGQVETVKVSKTTNVGNSDKLIFADGTVSTFDLYAHLSPVSPTVAPTPTGETSVSPTLPTTLNATVKAYAVDSAGENFAPVAPGINLVAIGSAGVDKVYVRAGSNVDASSLGGSFDKIYMTGSWADYTKAIAGTNIVFQRTVGANTEYVKIAAATGANNDVIVFADGTVRSNDAKIALQTNVSIAATSITTATFGAVAGWQGGWSTSEVTPSVVPRTIADLDAELIATQVTPIAVSIADTTANLVPGGVVSSYVTSGVAVEVTDAISVANLALIDVANTGGALKYASLIDTQANLSGSAYVGSGVAVTVTDAASIAQLAALDTANGTASVTVTAITDTAANLFPGGVISAYIQPGVTVTVTGAISFANLSLIDAANGAAAVTYGGISGTLSEINSNLGNLVGVAVTVTDAVGMLDLWSIEGATGVAPVATSITDTVANLAGYSQYITSGVNITVTDAITVAALGVIDAANGAGTLTYSLSDTQANLSGNAYIKSGVAVTVTSDATVAQLNVHDTANGAASVTATSITDTAANLAAGLAFVTGGVAVNVTGTISLASLQTIDGANGGGALNYSAVSGTLTQINDVTLGAYVVSGVTVTVTDAVSLADLSAIQAITGVQPVATTLVDTAANLAPGGVASGYVTSGTAVTVSDAISIDALAALDAANGVGVVTASAISDVAAKLAPAGVASSYIKAGVAVTVTDTISAAYLTAIDTANGVGALAYSGITGTLAQVTPYVASNVTVTVTDAVTVTNLSTIQATSVIKPVATIISDTSANLVQDLIGGGTNYVTNGVAVTVTDAITLANLTSIDTANGGASVTISSMTDTAGQLAIARNTLNLDGVALTVTDAIALSEFVALDVANGTALVILGSASGINGTAGAADSLQLSPSLNTIDLGVYNQSGQPTLSGFEIFDMSTDTSANVVKLTAAGLFLQASNFFDATTGYQTVVINGGSNDTVYRPAASDWAMQGAANSFDVSGAAGAGYSQYFVTYTGTGAVMEVLIQNGVVIL